MQLLGSAVEDEVSLLPFVAFPSAVSWAHLTSGVSALSGFFFFSMNCYSKKKILSGRDHSPGRSDRPGVEISLRSH